MQKSNSKSLRHRLNPVDSSLGFLGAILALFGASFVFEFIVILINFNKYLADPDNITLIMSAPWFLILSSIITQGALLGFCILLCKIRHVNFAKAAAINQKLSLWVIIIIPLLSLFLIMSNTPLLVTADKIFQTIKYTVPDLPIDQLMSSPLGIIAVIITTCVLPAICEEFVFRGLVLQGLASRFKPFTAIILSAFAFSMMHMSPAQTVHQFILGITLGYVVLTAKSVWAGVLLHFFNNFWAVIGTITQNYGFGALLIENTTFIYISAVFFAIIGLAIFFLSFDFAAKKQKDSIFIQAISKFSNSEKVKRYRINYDVIVAPFYKVFDAGTNMFVEQPISSEEYKIFAHQKEIKHRRVFIALMCIAFGICIAMWIFSLVTGMML